MVVSHEPALFSKAGNWAVLERYLQYQVIYLGYYRNRGWRLNINLSGVVMCDSYSGQKCVCAIKTAHTITDFSASSISVILYLLYMYMHTFALQKTVEHTLPSLTNIC